MGPPLTAQQTLQQQAKITSLELQLEQLDSHLIDAITANEQSRAACENLIRNLGGIGGVAKLVMGCHEMATDIQNFEAELAALNGEELNLREENVVRRAELERAIQCMETLLLDVASPMAKKALFVVSGVPGMRPRSAAASTAVPSPAASSTVGSLSSSVARASRR